MNEGYRFLRFTPRFIADLIALSPVDQKHVARSLKLIDENEKTPSLRVHELQGQLKGIWSASASKSLRFTFMRLPEGHKLLLTIDHHYGD